MVAILITRGSRENQVTAVTLAIQRFCAIIAYNEDAECTTWTEISRGEDITCEQRSTTRALSESCMYAR